MRSFVSRINWITMVIAVIAVLAIYLGVKLVPMWWQAREVDSEIESFRYDVLHLKRYETDPNEQRIADDLWEKVVDLGVDEETLQVYWGDDYSSLHVEYDVRMAFPFGLERTFHFHRHKTFTQ